MNDMELMWELGQETPLPGHGELGPARDRLTAAIATESTASGRPAGAARRRRVSPVWRLALATAATVLAVASAAIALRFSGSPATPKVDPAAARVLNNAALAALRLHDGAPRPDQFVYTKMENGDGSLYQSWLSVDGTRTGLIRGADGAQTITVAGCRNGRQLVHPQDNPNMPPSWQSCVARPAYHPDMPANPAAMQSYLDKTFGVRPGDPAYQPDMEKGINELLTQAYLSSGQRAALYELMATTPGFTVMPDVADIIGRRGVGVAWPPSHGGGRLVIIFHVNTYAELGVTTLGAHGEKGGSALLKIAIVNKAGQLPN
jgi:hypothetical protein